MTFIPSLRIFEKDGVRKTGPTITVSGLSGSGKDTVAEALAKAFRLQHVRTGDIFRAAAKDMGIPLEVAATAAPPSLHLKADSQNLELASRGNCVIVGRLSGWDAGEHADYRIFLNPPLETRAKWVSKREKLPVATAIEKLRQRDEENASAYRKVYAINFSDLSIYHLVLDNSLFSQDDANKLIVKIVRQAIEKRWRKK